MPEVHLTLYDRQLIAAHILPAETPAGLRRGTWANLRSGDACFVEYSEWVHARAVFPARLNFLLEHAPLSVPKEFSKPAGAGENGSSRGRKRPPPVPWDAAEW
jgi:hypothetical protein